MACTRYRGQHCGSKASPEANVPIPDMVDHLSEVVITGALDVPDGMTTNFATQRLVSARSPQVARRDLNATGGRGR